MRKPTYLLSGVVAIVLGLAFAWWAVQAVWLSAFTGANVEVLEHRFVIRAVLSVVLFILAAYLFRRGFKTSS